jgi:hypothetical protein
MRPGHDLPTATSPQGLVIASIRTHLTLAYANLLEVERSAASTRGSWQQRAELVGFAKDGEVIELDEGRRKEVEVGYEREIRQAQQVVSQWEQALDVALAAVFS